jgi:hypothetical protein
MATLALRPAYPVRPQSGSKRDPHQPRARRSSRMRWRTIAIAVGALTLGAFSVLAPLIGDPSGRLLALDATPTISAHSAWGGEAWPARPFEFTPALLGPTIAADMLSLIEEETLAEEDWPVMTMPALEVRALPPIAAEQRSPQG